MLIFLFHISPLCLNAISPFRHSNQVLERHLALVSDSPLDSSTLEGATLSSSYCRIYLRGSSDFVTRILLEGFSPLSRSNLLVFPQKESSFSCSRDQNQFMTGTLHISEAVLLPRLQTCPQHENDLRPTLGSDRGQEQEGEGPRRGRRGWWRPRRWCPPRRGSCPPGGWRGWCRGSSTFRRI